MNERLNELLLAWEDDELISTEVDELVALLEREPTARSAVVDHFSLSCSIGEQLRETLHDESVVRELQHITTLTRSASEEKNPRSRFGLVSLTVVVLLIGTFAAYHFDVHKLIIDKFAGETEVDVVELRPEVVSTFGKVQLVDSADRTDIIEGTILDLGSSLRTSKHAYATLKYPDGTTIQLRGETQITIEPIRSGKHLTLQQGGLFADVAPQRKGAPLVLNPSRHDRVEVVGTRFEFVRNEATSVLRVEEGSVQFGTKQQAVEVAEREESKASAKQQPTTPQQVEPEAIWQGWEHGLRGDYYKWHGFGREFFTRIDPHVDFHWGKGVPDPTLNRSFAVRWTGEIEAPHDGEFTFYTVADCGVRLWVNDAQLIDSWMSMGAEEESRPIQLEKGKRYPIKIEYWDRHGDAKMRLMWSSKSLPKAIVNQRSLYPAIENTNPTRQRGHDAN